jgi:hypothetical protein
MAATNLLTVRGEETPLQHPDRLCNRLHAHHFQEQEHRVMRTGKNADESVAIRRLSRWDGWGIR